MRTLITFATLSACPITIALACLVLVGGCEEKQEIDRNVIADTNCVDHYDYVETGYEATYLYDHDQMQFASDTNIIPQPYQPDPCPPCPDTVMPPGRWAHVLTPLILQPDGSVCLWRPIHPDSMKSRYFRERMNQGRLRVVYSETPWPWPDSVFILKKE